MTHTVSPVRGRGHCAPGALHRQSTAWDGKLQRCYNYDTAANGVTPDPTLGVHQLDLPEPMVAGAPYALSVAVNFRTAGQNIEFWGTSGDCGHADEQLYTDAVEQGVLCMDLHPTQVHQSILMIWRGQGSIEIGDLTICAHAPFASGARPRACSESRWSCKAHERGLLVILVVLK